MNIDKKKYCCLYIPLKKESLYFEIVLENKDLGNVLKVLKLDLKINFKIKNSLMDKSNGILLMDNIDIKKSNKLFICHFLNLLKYVNNNISLISSNKLLELYNNFLLSNSINEK